MLPGTLHTTRCIDAAVRGTRHVLQARKTLPDPRQRSNANAPFKTTTVWQKVNTTTGLCRTLTYLLELVGFGLILIPVRILPISHAQPPHSQDAVDVVPYPSIFMVRTSWKQPCHWILTTAEGIKNKHYYLKSHLLSSTSSFPIKG